MIKYYKIIYFLEENMKKTRGFFGEFREFIMRGNVIDMAVGVVIATAFGKITTSLVNEVIMPFIGWLIGDIDLTKWNIVIEKPGVDPAAEPGIVIAIGSFISTIINFIIIAFIIFIIVKMLNKARERAEAKKKAQAEEEAAAEDPKPTTEELLAQILEEIKKEKK